MHQFGSCEAPQIVPQGLFAGRCVAQHLDDPLGATGYGERMGRVLLKGFAHYGMQQVTQVAIQHG